MLHKRRKTRKSAQTTKAVNFHGNDQRNLEPLNFQALNDDAKPMSCLTSKWRSLGTVGTIHPRKLESWLEVSPLWLVGIYVQSNKLRSHVNTTLLV